MLPKVCLRCCWLHRLAYFNFPPHYELNFNPHGYGVCADDHFILKGPHMKHLSVVSLLLCQKEIVGLH